MLKLFNFLKDKDALHLPTQTFRKVFWEFKAQIEFMGLRRIRSIQNALQEEVQEAKVLKLLQGPLLLRYVQIQQVLLEFQRPFVEFTDSNQQEVRDFQLKEE